MTVTGGSSLFKRFFTLSLSIVLAVTFVGLLAGCGGGKGLTDNLVQFHNGASWTYKLTGSVTLPADQGGGSQNIQPTSTMIMTVSDSTIKDANNLPVKIIDSKIKLVLLDGREIKANYRLYITQDQLGVFVHGFNTSMGDTIDTANDKFAPSTATPPFMFLYLPNPASAGRTIVYDNPLGLVGVDGSYHFSISNSDVLPITVPAGTFRARPATFTENFDNIAFTNVALVPSLGLVTANINARLPDTTLYSGVFVLTDSHI
jgi:hypothetical protein